MFKHTNLQNSTHKLRADDLTPGGRQVKQLYASVTPNQSKHSYRNSSESPKVRAIDPVKRFPHVCIPTVMKTVAQ
jgi:hypothetical protein